MHDGPAHFGRKYNSRWQSERELSGAARRLLEPVFQLLFEPLSLGKREASIGQLLPKQFHNFLLGRRKGTDRECRIERVALDSKSDELELAVDLLEDSRIEYLVDRE